ncbi:MAG: CinA family protein [Solobacterium sp.]|nr:CinA family protein [Solobacterium sp.]
MQDNLILAAARLKKELENRHLTLATCESLTCGMIASSLGEIPGVSAVYAGGAVTYMTMTKAILAGVSEDHLERFGAVDPETARQMCEGIRERLGTDCAIAVTGNAGPVPMEDKGVGLVYIAVNDGIKTYVREYQFSGDRSEIRTKTALRAIEDLTDRIKRTS